MKSVTWRDGYGRRDRPGELVVVVDSERDDAQRPPPLSIKVVAPEHDEISRAEDPLLGSDSPPSRGRRRRTWCRRWPRSLGSPSEEVRLGRVWRARHHLSDGACA